MTFPNTVTSHTARARALVRQMTIEEKISLVCGQGLWRTAGVPRLGLPCLLMVDGSNGIRFVPDQVPDNGQDGDLGAFLNVVAATDEGERAEPNALLGKSVPSTCFPALSVLANSWDVTLAHTIGKALAIECRGVGAQILLGPGINLRRCPLAGRSFEYFSEDPVLTGDMAAGFIQGLQDHGVAASLKHLACNNSEVERISMDSIVEPRALHELYLLGFERAIAQANPWTVMTSYNLLNGVHPDQDPWLLQTVLRGQWSYEGAVMSDWHGIQDRPAALNAGTDLDMPFNSLRHRRLSQAIKTGAVSTDVLDESCVRIAALTLQVTTAQQTIRTSAPDFTAHHALARQAAERSCVLLLNKDAILPLRPQPGDSLLVVGTGARTPEIQGAGSAAVRPRCCDIPLEALTQAMGRNTLLEWQPGWAEDGSHCATRHAAALEAARHADTVVVFAGTPPAISGENADRPDLGLCPAHDAFITALSTFHKRIVVVLTHPDAVLLPWVDRVSAILSAGYAGEGFGQAAANLLSGKAVPSGKTSVTWPERLEDCPAFLGYPGEQSRHIYREGIFAGYRYFDIRGITPLFPFGHGLSYTTFAYADLSMQETDSRFTASFTLANTGTRDAYETCQLYIGRPSPPLNRTGLHHPVRMLRGFRSIFLRSGESKAVTLSFTRRDLSCFDPTRGIWTLPGGPVTVEIGASSRDIRLSLTMEVSGDAPPPRYLDLYTPPGQALEAAGLADTLASWLVETVHLPRPEVMTRLENSRQSFLGIYDTLCWVFERELDENTLMNILQAINHRTGARKPA
ncbi:glycosyl hydrolase [Komagataeibacter rhaeticus]|mgnify:CR=1 FL=1|uniref:beta-glucosidase n=1 Tax=Komagataeibacter rhaeticus TaxID=215221 RepID=UPI0006904042|nr:glycoside hydrolase family 3 C-terminal domain-containing protein [Komagataeibacter rhaeticus]MBL7239659.1 glycoside hydrolase family 3 C-terminal domain-containing protein [Komagataeibacter rhaeticus]PYD53116.1 glycosyl hydrolase [Komagataeibacter rhaeticus]GBQ13066.1 beta-glucosidase-related glycosidase [Komagataeibacter rhaeticus DSM 16663]